MLSEIMEKIFKPDVLFARPSSVEEVYLSVACNAIVLLVPEKDVAEYRKVVDTLYTKPVLLAESSATELVGADGVIYDGKCVLKERLGVEQSTKSTLQLTATLTETTLTISDGTRDTTLALAKINPEEVPNQPPTSSPNCQDLRTDDSRGCRGSD